MRKPRKRAAPPPPDILELNLYSPEGIDRIVECTGLPLPPTTITFSYYGDGRDVAETMDRREGLRNRLNRAAAYWAFAAESDGNNPQRSRANEPWRNFVKNNLKATFEAIFEAKATTISAFRDGKWVASSPFTRFAVEASRQIGQMTTEEAVRDLMRGKRPLGGSRRGA